MTQLQNQQSQTPIQGQLDMQYNSNVINAVVDTTSGGGLVPGTPVKIVDNAGGVPKVVECAADTDDVIGFIQYAIRNATYAVGDAVPIALVNGGAAMYLAASAAIARGASVMVVISGVKVATATSGKTIVGRALDKAAANGDLIRILMLPVKQSA
jgi:hypothetical protein